GKMGKVIARCIDEKDNIKIVSGVDIKTDKYSDFHIYSDINECPLDANVLIDFSHPSALDKVLDFAVKNKIPAVIATTGYNQEQIAKIKEASKKVAIFFTFNMSLGINLLCDLAKRASCVLGKDFDIEIIEKHHNQKIDAPSGTAIMLANSVADDNTFFEYDRHSKRKKREKNEIGIHSIRGGTIVGEHEVIFAGHDEVLTLSHLAMSKEIFAVGAVNAAIFLKDKSAGLYEMKDMI
ncbi:MAG: 4-hydroxy-tetrahydrodipicolinate reductase, partial [Oscillospiraceae bacterium]